MLLNVFAKIPTVWAIPKHKVCADEGWCLKSARSYQIVRVVSTEGEEAYQRIRSGCPPPSASDATAPFRIPFQGLQIFFVNFGRRMRYGRYGTVQVQVRYQYRYGSVEVLRQPYRTVPVP